METFPNVIGGLKKVFKAQIFLLIGQVLFYVSLMIIGVFSVVALAAEASDTALGTATAISLLASNAVLLIIMLVCFIVGLVLMIIGYINNIIGVKRAGKDEDGYNTAFWCIIFALIVAVVSAILQMCLPAYSAADEIAGVIGKIMEILGMVFVIQSTQIVLVKQGKEEYAMKGNNVVFFIIIPYALSLIARIITIFVVSSTVDLIVMIISLICAVVGYILYLVFIKKSSNLLKAVAEEAAPAQAE